MIIVKMMGQLGNQLFIYAMVRSLQKQYGGKIYIDLSSLKRHYYTADYKLFNYNLPKDIISYDLDEVSPDIIKKFQRYTKIFHVEQKALRTLLPRKQLPNSVVERWFKKGCYFNFNRQWYPYQVSDSDTKFVYGYFQSEKYFDAVKDELMQDLQLTIELNDNEKQFLDSIKSSESVGVSIRITNKFKNVQSFISKEYYIEGIKRIMLMKPDSKFYIFADDIAAVKEKIDFPVPVVYVTPESSVTGLYLLSNCKHFVIANSTFSWWGAYLSYSENKIIVMSEPWDKEDNREDIYFDGCIRVPCTFSEEITE